ncbi:MAG TPA: Lrp/AsnC family transcriptional regulator [bacterium]
MIDELDIKIIELLEKNGRTQYNDIAGIVGLRPPSVIERIKKLEEKGVIRGYRVLLDEKCLGIDITAFIGVNVNHPKNIKQFELQIKKIGNEILECHHVTGDYTLILKVKTKNTQTLEKLIDKIRGVKGVIRTYTMVVFSTIREQSALPVELLKNYASLKKAEK